MINFGIPEEKRVRVIIDTDAKNEVDDQFAIVQAVLSQSFDIKGIIAAHFGSEKSPHSMRDSYEEIKKVLSLLNSPLPVFEGAAQAMQKEGEPVLSEGARLIAEEAEKDDVRPLYIAFLGPLTDMAAALSVAPVIAQKNVTVIWIGGGAYPCGGREYNLKNDIIAANAVFASNVRLWQVPRNVYRMMPVTFAELWTRVRPYGKIGKYLAENVVSFNNGQASRPTEYRILGDSPAVGIMLYNDCGEWEEVPAPAFGKNMEYISGGNNRPIRVYKNINSRFILEDLYAKLKLASEN